MASQLSLKLRVAVTSVHQLCIDDDTESIKGLTNVLCDVMDAVSSNSSKPVSQDLDLFKLTFISFPLMRDSADRVLNSLLFQHQNNLQYLQRLSQDIGTMLELKDSRHFRARLLAQLGTKHKMLNHSMTDIQPHKEENSANQQDEADNKVHMVYFEEMVEEFVNPTIVVNIDNIKLLAVFFLEKICSIFILVGLYNENFGSYYSNKKRHLPFDPYLLLMNGVDSTSNPVLIEKIRESFNNINKLDIFSKHPFSFKVDLFEKRTLDLPVNNQKQVKSVSHSSSFIDNEEDSDLFSEKDNSEASISKKDIGMMNKAADMGPGVYNNSVSADDKAAIIQDWLFQGIDLSPDGIPFLSANNLVKSWLFLDNDLKIFFRFIFAPFDISLHRKATSKYEKYIKPLNIKHKKTFKGHVPLRYNPAKHNVYYFRSRRMLFTLMVKENAALLLESNPQAIKIFCRPC